MTKPAPARYRTTNWKSYNDGLRRRGSLLIWLDKDMLWLAPKAGRNGRPPVFSAEEGTKTVQWPVFPTKAIQFCLMVKVLFGLPLRQTIGMVASILSMAGLDWPVPDFSTLSRRQKTIDAQITQRLRQARSTRRSTAQGSSSWANEMGPWLRGSRVSPSNEWLVSKHGTHRRRQYRKVHLAMDTTTSDIRAVEFTSSDQGDSPIRRANSPLDGLLILLIAASAGPDPAR